LFAAAVGSGACNCALSRLRERAQRGPPCVGIIRKGARIEFRRCWNIERPKAPDAIVERY
jgi:hypothetical protein